jgi:hypothetical protein
MRVLILRGQPSARARVQALALSVERPDFEVALARRGGRGGEDLAREWALGERPARGLREAIADFAPDVIHSHGPSAFLTVCANELTAGRIPVVHDVGRTRRVAIDPDLERRAVEESDALIVPSHELLEELSSCFATPGITCVFPSYPLARELPPDERHLSAESQIGRLATLYERLAREPLAGIAGELRGR